MALFPAVEERADRATRAAEPWVERLARMGYAARGVVYLIVGGLALQAAIGRGGRTTGTQGALSSILRQPFGRAMLAVVAVGLAGYALWRLVQALRDPEGAGRDAKGVLKRALYLISGAIHVSLAVEAARLAMGGGGGRSGDQSAQHWTATLMAQPFGRWAVAAVGIGIVAFGLFELGRAFGRSITRRLDLGRLGPSGRRWIVRLGRLGLAARGIVFGLIGTFLVRAALAYDPGQAHDLGGALTSLRDEPFGAALLGGVAAGLMGYGVLELVKARYRRIDAS